MRYSGIDKAECCNGIGWGVSLYTQGCHFHCKNCFNQETWDFNGGKEFTEETEDTILALIKPEYIERFSILGGEPLEERNLWDLANLIVNIRIEKPEIKIWLYTGFTYEWLDFISFTSASRNERDFLQIILKEIDVLVDGQFIEDKKDLTYPFAGSTNQRVIDISKTREQKQIVLLDI